MLQFQICYHNHLNVSQKRKLTQISGTKPGSDPLQSAGSRALFYPISIMPQISTEDSGILQLTKNAKTNNNTAGYHLVSLREISTPSDAQLVYRCPKKDLHITPKICFSFKYVIRATSMCYKKKKTNINFRDQTWH